MFAKDTCGRNSIELADGDDPSTRLPRPDCVGARNDEGEHTLLSRRCERACERSIYGGVVTSHRVSGVSGSGEELGFYTKGDANNAGDAEQVSPRHVLGRVAFSVPLAGYAIDFAGRPIGRALMLGIPLLLLILEEIRSRRSRRYQQAKEQETG